MTEKISKIKSLLEKHHTEENNGLLFKYTLKKKK